MSDSVAIAQGFAVAQANATRQALQIEALRQQAQSDQSVVALLQKGTETSQAVLPQGQGRLVDVTA